MTAYVALMHCHRPLRFNPPADDGADGPPPHALPLPALAKRAFRFAGVELAHLARVFGFKGPVELRVAVAPALLAAASPVEAARAAAGMHAVDGPVATEAASITKDLDPGVRLCFTDQPSSFPVEHALGGAAALSCSSSADM